VDHQKHNSPKEKQKGGHDSSSILPYSAKKEYQFNEKVKEYQWRIKSY